MGLKPGRRLRDIQLDTVFIGSCTNSRLEDLRMAAQYVKGKHVAPDVRAMVVPGSMQVRRMAEEEGLADIFREAGFEWREAGCSMCIAMNGDRLAKANAAPPPATATSRAARDAADAPTSSVPPWPPPPPSPVTSWIFAMNNNN